MVCLCMFICAYCSAFQVAGSKYIRLYDPAHTHRMRMHSPYSVTPNTSTVDLLAVEGKHTSGYVVQCEMYGVGVCA
jgi:hypothetical protein